MTSVVSTISRTMKSGVANQRSSFPHKEVVTVVLVAHWHNAAEEPQNRVPVRIDLVVVRSSPS
jgi:hypothetical protein